jgi:hypothetical protein
MHNIFYAIEFYEKYDILREAIERDNNPRSYIFIEILIVLLIT